MTKIFKGYHTAEGGFTGTFQESSSDDPIPVNLTRETWLAVQYFMIMSNQSYTVGEIQGEQP